MHSKGSTPGRPKHVCLVANGDLRISANQKCWPTQKAMEAALVKVLRTEGRSVKRGHAFEPKKKHGFIDSQKMGLDVFRRIDPHSPLIVAEAVWQYSQHILGGLLWHEGPILTIANWSGTWPGLVGLLNLNASLTKAGIKYSSLWSKDFSDDFFRDGLRRRLRTGRLHHDESHVRALSDVKLPVADEKLGRQAGAKFKQRRAIIGVFDEGCMGMFNAIVPDELLHETGILKERLSQSTLYAEMLKV